MYSSFPPSWSLYNFIKINPPSKKFISLHIKSPIYMMKALSDLTEVQWSSCLFFIQWLCWWNACWASITISVTWNSKSKSTSENSKLIKIKRGQTLQADFFQSAHSEKDTWCIRSMQCIVGGYFFTLNDCGHLKHYKHTTGKKKERIDVLVLHHPKI